MSSVNKRKNVPLTAFMTTHSRNMKSIQTRQLVRPSPRLSPDGRGSLIESGRYFSHKDCCTLGLASETLYSYQTYDFERTTWIFDQLETQTETRTDSEFWDKDGISRESV